MSCFMHGHKDSQVEEFHINEVQRVAKGERHAGSGCMDGRWGEERRRVDLSQSKQLGWEWTFQEPLLQCSSTTPES